jgi:hypothetical protein
MSESSRPSRTETILYDGYGNRTEDESVAVRGEVVEVDEAGRVVARHPHPELDWEVDPKSLEGDGGEMATRPRHGRAEAQPSPSTRSATESTIREGRNGNASAWSRLVEPVRTRMLYMPASRPATMSVSIRSPTIAVVSE